jgi:hypothetical protein
MHVEGMLDQGGVPAMRAGDRTHGVVRQGDEGFAR